MVRIAETVINATEYSQNPLWGMLSIAVRPATLVKMIEEHAADTDISAPFEPETIRMRIEEAANHIVVLPLSHAVWLTSRTPSIIEDVDTTVESIRKIFEPCGKSISRAR